MMCVVCVSNLSNIDLRGGGSVKIAQVIGICAPGGSEIFAKNLSKELKQAGHEVEVWVLSGVVDADARNVALLKFEQSYVKDLEECGIKVRFVGKRPRKDWQKTKFALTTFFRNFKPDIVHCHLENVAFHTSRSIAGKVPIVQTIHSVVIYHPYVQKFYLLEKLAANVAISRKVYTIISELLGPRARIYTIYNGIPVSNFLRKRTINEDVRNIVAIGRLEKEKDYPNLLSAVSMLKKRLLANGMPLINVNIVGSGSLENDLKNLTSKMGLSDIVNFLGIRNDIPELLMNNDIYVMASEWEGLSISLIEALASGIPIVATNAGSNSEIVDNGVNGIIVPTKNPEALSEAIYSLILDQELRRRFSIEAQKKAKIFSIEQCAENHIRMYEEILNGKV